MKNYSVNFLFLFYCLMDCHTRPNFEGQKGKNGDFTFTKTVAYDPVPEFEIETVKGIEDRDTNGTKIRDHFLQLMDYNRQRKLCEDAKVYALYKGVPVKFYYSEMAVKAFTIVQEMPRMDIVQYEYTPTTKISSVPEKDIVKYEDNAAKMKPSSVGNVRGKSIVKYEDDTAEIKPSVSHSRVPEKSVVTYKRTSTQKTSSSFENVPKEEKYEYTTSVKTSSCLGGVPQKNVVNYELTPDTRTSCFGCIGLECPTVPIIVLCLDTDNSMDKMKLVVKKNQFLDSKYNFLEEIVESVQYLAALDYYYNEKTKEGDYIFSELGMKDRWEVCVAAKERISSKVIVNPVDYWPEIVGMYTIVYEEDWIVPKVIAFMCNSSPKMYIRRTAGLPKTYQEIFWVTMEESEVELVINRSATAEAKSETKSETKSDIFFSALGSPRKFDSSSQRHLDASSSSKSLDMQSPVDAENFLFWSPSISSLKKLDISLMRRLEPSFSSKSLDIYSPRDSEISPVASPTSPRRSQLKLNKMDS